MFAQKPLTLCGVGGFFTYEAVLHLEVQLPSEGNTDVWITNLLFKWNGGIIKKQKDGV